MFMGKIWCANKPRISVLWALKSSNSSSKLIVTSKRLPCNLYIFFGPNKTNGSTNLRRKKRAKEKRQGRGGRVGEQSNHSEKIQFQTPYKDVNFGTPMSLWIHSSAIVCISIAIGYSIHEKNPLTTRSGFKVNTVACVCAHKYRFELAQKVVRCILIFIFERLDFDTIFILRSLNLDRIRCVCEWRRLGRLHWKSTIFGVFSSNVDTNKYENYTIIQ